MSEAAARRFAAVGIAATWSDRRGIPAGPGLYGSDAGRASSLRRVPVTRTLPRCSARTTVRGTRSCFVQVSRSRFAAGWAKAAHFRARSRTMQGFDTWPHGIPEDVPA